MLSGADGVMRQRYYHVCAGYSLAASWRRLRKSYRGMDATKFNRRGFNGIADGQDRLCDNREHHQQNGIKRH